MRKKQPKSRKPFELSELHCRKGEHAVPENAQHVSVRVSEPRDASQRTERWRDEKNEPKSEKLLVIAREKPGYE